MEGGEAGDEVITGTRIGPETTGLLVMMEMTGQPLVGHGGRVGRACVGLIVVCGAAVVGELATGPELSADSSSSA